MVKKVFLDKLQQQELAVAAPPRLEEAGPVPMDVSSPSPTRPAGGAAAADTNVTQAQSPEEGRRRKKGRTAGGAAAGAQKVPGEDGSADKGGLGGWVG
jgi:hypothetical protein